jgi:Protein of unknown function (DUF3107)
VDVRIGVTYSTKELELDLGDEVKPDKVKGEIEAALSGSGALWLTDRRGRQVAVPVDKVAYVEIGSPEDIHRIGFGG